VRHHEDTIAAYAAQVIDHPATLALIVVGSVARGTARPTSDVDVYLVVTDDAFAAAQSASRVAYIDTEAATYDCYVDVKLVSPRYLERAVAHADDPTRASFLGARTVFDHTASVIGKVTEIITLSDDVWRQRVHAYRCQARLYGGYFLKQAHERNDRFLLHHSAVHLCFAVGRVALAVNRTLFQGQKYLAATLSELADLPDGFLSAWHGVLADPTPDSAAVLTDLVDAWQGGPLNLEDSLSTFIIDNELAWLNGTVPPEFW
jgi:predicted nucleotidyltransferase